MRLFIPVVFNEAGQGTVNLGQVPNSFGDIDFTRATTLADVIVNVPNGAIRGLEKSTLRNRTFYAFFQIPYAKPPVGSLRFKDPQPAQAWTGVLNATRERTICHQVSSNSETENEDCLYLNVYTPVKLGRNTSSSLPVMFYIHGGGFINGYSTYIVAGPQHLIDNDVVVVTIHYRLGPFGFLSTQDSVLQGNYGLKDQRLALHWVQDNIRHFGGDPDRVSIFGQSSGAVSVGYHVTSSSSKGLFGGAIQLSGSVLSPHGYQRNAKQMAYKLAQFIDPGFSNETDSEGLLRFLQNATAKQIDAATEKFTQQPGSLILNEGSWFAPVIENCGSPDAFVTTRMYEAVENGGVAVPLMLGVTSEEAVSQAADLDGFKRTVAQHDDNPAFLVQSDMHITDAINKTAVGKAIREIYTEGLLQDNLGMAVRYCSDAYVNKAVIRQAELQSTYGDVYLYQFSYHGALGGNKVQVEGAERVSHSEDLRYLWVFNDSADISSIESKDLRTVDRYVKLFTNFAKTRNPTPEEDKVLGNVQWPKVDKQNFYYLDIGEDVTVKTGLKKSTYGKWVQFSADLDIIVDIKNGPVQGRLDVTYNKKEFYSFLQIPYAKPPVGKLRFMEPEPVEDWVDVLDATVNDAQCYQFGLPDAENQTEDCLYVNVFTPVLADSNASLPVMFYIHGGAFLNGNPLSQFYGPHYFMEQDVVVVLVAYRLGPFGFLSTGDEVVPGNMGLKDQVLALKWVQENIATFGGDPSKVTLFGLSAGGASATLQMLSEQSKGLFRGVISESGSALCPWAYQRGAKQVAYDMATFLDPDFSKDASSEELVELLQSVTPEELLNSTITFPWAIGRDQLVQGFEFAPVVEPESESAFLTGRQYDLIEDGSISTVPLMIGYMSEEQISRAGDEDGFLWLRQQYDETPAALVTDDMHIINESTKALVGEEVKKIYTDTTFEEDIAAAVHYFSDVSFSIPIIHHAKLQSSSSDVYLYQFSYHGDEATWNNISVEGCGSVMHGEDSEYLWCYNNNDNIEEWGTEADILTTKRYVKLFTNFAKFLNPTPEESELFENIIWPAVTPDGDFQYLDIDAELEVKTDPKGEVYPKWVQLYEKRAEPEPVEDWVDVLDATVNDAQCYQFAMPDAENQTEDCLYVNVFTPVLADSSASLPVMFYIHGGGFLNGNPHFQQFGPHYFMEQDVVVVLVAYRLGPFGFLSTGDKVVPGNMGLKDQVLALKWVQENIATFGGDPSKVTLFGLSAGGASVTLQMLSEQSKGLFRGVIAESGSALCPWAYQRGAKQVAYDMAMFLDPDFSKDASSEELVELLQSVTPEELMNSTNTFPRAVGRDQLVQGFEFAPVVEAESESAFLTARQYDLIEDGSISTVPLMIGYMSEEQILRAGDEDGFLWLRQQYDATPAALVTDDMHIINESTKALVGEEVKKIYTDTTFEEDIAAAVHYFSDVSFSIPIIHHAKLQSSSSDVYLYQFSYHGDQVTWNNVTVEGCGRVVHGEDSGYLWGYYNNGNIEEWGTEADILATKRYVKLFTNFAKFLNPTPEESELFENIIWPAVTPDGDFQYLDIDAELEVKTDPKGEVYPKWVQLYEKRAVKPYDTF
ncbi:hypothetical protein NQ315_006436 [Exocentrus adspersus]|uniref:Carboxylesterase type B domain-containing protein n=1 Tax=Exocentrus adspersus TaxID=1586481 RepID=A0AAV8VZQ8_9CUCU|nr:hypothetical protein NQ315_006436 [Exocentrus adspersus]